MANRNVYAEVVTQAFYDFRQAERIALLSADTLRRCLLCRRRLRSNHIFDVVGRSSRNVNNRVVLRDLFNHLHARLFIRRDKVTVDIGDAFREDTRIVSCFEKVLAGNLNALFAGNARTFQMPAVIKKACIIAVHYAAEDIGRAIRLLCALRCAKRIEDGIDLRRIDDSSQIRSAVVSSQAFYTDTIVLRK